MVRDGRGFTLIELMIVVVVIGILAAIAIPNFVALQGRAREANVKSNMHVLQIGTEDFSALSSGRYPTGNADTADDGSRLEQLLPTQRYPRNPFTQAPTVVVWSADPTSGNRGEIGFNPAAADSYRLKGNGVSRAILPLVLSHD